MPWKLKLQPIMDNIRTRLRFSFSDDDIRNEQLTLQILMGI